MSDSDEKESKQKRQRRKRRRRVPSAPATKSDDIPDREHYTQLVLHRLDKSGFLPKTDQEIVAMQRRHVNNYQHAIPFHQQFAEEMAEQEVDRRLNEDRKKQADLRKYEAIRDKRGACILCQTEGTTAEKERQLRLLNNRSLVQKLIQEHLDHATPQGQLRRIKTLETNFIQLQEKYDQLLLIVNQNKEKCDDNKREHDHQIEELSNRFENYRREIDQYRRETTILIVQLQEKLNRLNEKQELLEKQQNKHDNAIKDLSIQRDTLAKLSLEIKQIIDARQGDINRLNQFSEKLDRIKDLLNQVRDVLEKVNGNDSINNELQEIRNLFVGQKGSMKDIDSRIQKIEQNIINHNQQLTAIEERLNNFKGIVRKLNQSINVLQSDLKPIEQQLQSMAEDLTKSITQINQMNEFIIDARQQVNKLRTSIESIGDRLTSSDKLTQDIAKIIERIQNLESRSISPPVKGISKDLEDKIQQLLGLADELENLKKRIDNLEQSLRTETQPEPAKETNYEELFQRIRDIVSPIFEFREQINIQINEAKILINDLKIQLDQLLNAPKEQPSHPSPPVFKRGKVVPYLESLPPIDLLDDICL